MVSVVVPVYNTEKYLRRCMDALTSQTIDPAELEIVVVNDGSTDSSCDILMEYQKRFPDIVKVYNKANGGQGSARNYGIEKATGQYIGFADSDDYVDRTMYEKMYRLALETGADITECHYHSMLETGEDESGQPLYKEIDTRGSIRTRSEAKELFFDPQVSPWNKLFKREVIVDNHIVFPEGMIYEDTSFYVKCIPFIKKQAYLDEKLVYYSVRANSTMTSARDHRVSDILQVLDDILGFYRRNGIYGEYKKELEYFCVKIAFCSNFSRIGRVSNRFIKKELFQKTFSFVNKFFPDYKKNEYFTGKTGLYIKSVNMHNCWFFADVLSRVMIG